MYAEENEKTKYYISVAVITAVLLGLIILGLSEVFREKTERFSEEVLQYKPVVEKYASEYGVFEYVPTLLAIMQVESGGMGDDVMQCSESLGLERNTLKPEESIRQGCQYFSELIQTAEDTGCDFNAVVQAYNYGMGYLYYVAENGHRHTSELAEQFAQIYSNNEKVEYNNPVAVKENGGWRYNYGNMFYTALVQQHILDEDKK